MKKYFIQTYLHLPPIKWMGEDVKDFFIILRKMIKEAPARISISKAMIEESLNITNLETNVGVQWETIFRNHLKWNWEKFLKNQGRNYGSIVKEGFDDNLGTSALEVLLQGFD